LGVKGNAMKTSINKSQRSTSLKAGRVARRAVRKPQVIELVPALINIKTILVPIDFSKTSKKALVYAVRMAEQFGSRIILLNVVEPIATPDFACPLVVEPEKTASAVRKQLEKVCRDTLLPANMVDRLLVRHGTPFAEITDAARTLNVDLIILTTHGYTGLKHVFMGSTAERVVRHAPCPVLTVREKEHEFV
jgi:nucleotide-binding universal stress UspA family protein